MGGQHRLSKCRLVLAQDSRVWGKQGGGFCLSATAHYGLPRIEPLFVCRLHTKAEQGRFVYVDYDSLGIGEIWGNGECRSAGRLLRAIGCSVKL